MEKLGQKEKHNHKWTNILKLTIFFAVMLAPFIAVLSKCLYALNPNAKDSYSVIDTSYQEINENNKDNLLIDKNTYTIYINNDKNSGTNNTSQFFWYEASYDFINEFELDFEPKGLGYTNNSSAGTTQFFYFYNEGTQTWTNYKIKDADFKLSFSFTFKSYTTYVPNTINFYNMFNVILTIPTFAKVDNTFYYAIEEIGNEPIFNWAKNTGIYSSIKVMTDGLGMSSTIALLLAYWSICTAVYIVFDIIIFMFTKITHFASE